ncbi:MAG: hypothetical protein IT432_03570 [Phycisphaerales bacterium]|nr:hypothetical protein [Phycisphaerales bacterium]
MSQALIKLGPNINDVLIISIYVPTLVCHILYEMRARVNANMCSPRLWRDAIGSYVLVVCIAAVFVGTVSVVVWHSCMSYSAYALGSWTRLPKMIWFHIIGVPGVGWLSWHWAREVIADSM